MVLLADRQQFGNIGELTSSSMMFQADQQLFQQQKGMLKIENEGTTKHRVQIRKDFNMMK